MKPICPDWDDIGSNGFALKGTRSSLMQKRIEFQVLRCSMSSELRNNDDPECEEPDTIDEYISDLEVETWVLNRQIDFTIYEGEPAFSIQEFLGGTLVNTEKSTTKYLNLQKNDITTATYN